MLALLGSLLAFRAVVDWIVSQMAAAPPASHALQSLASAVIVAYGAGSLLLLCRVGSLGRVCRTASAYLTLPSALAAGAWVAFAAGAWWAVAMPLAPLPQVAPQAGAAPGDTQSRLIRLYELPRPIPLDWPEHVPLALARVDQRSEWSGSVRRRADHPMSFRAIDFTVGLSDGTCVSVVNRSHPRSGIEQVSIVVTDAHGANDMRVAAAMDELFLSLGARAVSGAD